MFSIAFPLGLRFQGWLLLLGTLAIVGPVACGSDSSPSPGQSLQRGDFGPLAVIDAGGGSQALGGTGPIQIDYNCATMTRENGEVLLLVWHAAEVSWGEVEQEITFSSTADPDAESITIRDGDTITVGGESLLDSDAPVERNLKWLATPHPTCSGEPFGVSSVIKS